MDAARSGINQQVNLTAEMANEIKVCQRLWPSYSILSFSSSLSISSWLFFSLPTASRDPDKEKNRDWKPHIRKKTDWWAFQNGNERFYCEYLTYVINYMFLQKLDIVSLPGDAMWVPLSYCNSCKSNILGEYNARKQLPLNLNNSNYSLIWILKS